MLLLLLLMMMMMMMMMILEIRLYLMQHGGVDRTFDS